MCRRIVAIILLSSLPLLSWAQVNLQTFVGRGVSDAGDLPGVNLSVSIGYELKSSFALQLSYRASHFGSARFSEDELQNIENLFIRDRWYENYPGLVLPSDFDIAGIELLPQTNFTRASALTIGINRVNTILKKRNISIFTSVGVGLERTYRTYIAQIRPITIDDDFRGTLTAPHIDAHMSPVLSVDLALTYRHQAWLMGPYFSINFSSINWTRSYGVFLRVSPRRATEQEE